MTAAYIKKGRISDILALIQVLGFDTHTHRSESGLQKELQRKPASTDSWTALAGEHPEFFRVRPEGEHVVSLVARHVTEPNEEGKRELPPEIVHKLLETAIDLYDRQVSRSERWKSFMPLWAALIGGIFGTASTLITLWFKGCPKP